jgi:hypothetical protein
MAKTRKAATARPPEVTACTAATLGADGRPPLDRPEWLLESTSAPLIRDALKALCAPWKAPRADFVDLTVDGTDVRLIVLPAYEVGPHEGRHKRLDAWKAGLRPLVDARRPKLAGGMHLIPVPRNLDPPSEEVALVGGWLRYLSKSLPGYLEPRGYLNVYTAKEAFPDGMNRGRTWWTTYTAIKLLLSSPARGRNEIWRQILEVARAPDARTGEES